MPIRRTRMIGGERFLKNRHDTNEIQYSIYRVKKARKKLSKLVKHKNELLKNAIEEWKKSANYKPRKLTGIRLQIFLSSRENYL